MIVVAVTKDQRRQGDDGKSYSCKHLKSRLVTDSRALIKELEREGRRTTAKEARRGGVEKGKKVEIDDANGKQASL